MVQAMRWSLLVLALLSGCAFGQPSPQEVYARSLKPTPIGPTQPSAPAPRVLLARVWADKPHARAVLGWQVRFHRLVKAANEVLSANLGVVIEIESMKVWDHEGGQDKMMAQLDALVGRDDGAQVDIVIGLTSPLPVFKPVLHALGVAMPFGKHMVMRGIEDAAEHVRLREVLDEFSSEERETLYQSRMRHRELLVLLHEVGHLLGAMHVWPEASIMHPGYASHQNSFSPTNLDVMKQGLQYRSREDPLSPEGRSALVQLIGSLDWSGLQKESRAYALAVLGGSDTEAPQATAEGPLDARGTMQRISALLAEGTLDRAWIMLEPLLKDVDKDPVLRRLACEILARKGPGEPTSLEHCRALVAAEPQVPGYRLLYALTLQKSGQPTEALTEVRAAETEVAAAVKTSDPAHWTALAQAYLRLDAVTWANQAAAHGDAGVAGQIAVHSRHLRKSTWLETAGVKPGEEPAYIALVRALITALQARDHARIAALFAQFSTAHTEASGPLAAVCTQYAKWERWRDVRRFCGKLAKLHPGRSEAHLALGVAAFAVGRPAQAVGPLQRAIKLRPQAKEAWSLLMAAYRASGRTKKAAALARRYQARFGDGG